MWRSNKKHSSSDMTKDCTERENNKSNTIKSSIKDFGRILRLKFEPSYRPVNMPKNINISTNDDIEIDIRPYYDKNDKCIYIPSIYSYTRFYNDTRIFVAKVPLSRDVIMECIRDCDESEK